MKPVVKHVMNLNELKRSARVMDAALGPTPLVFISSFVLRNIFVLNLFYCFTVIFGIG